MLKNKYGLAGRRFSDEDEKPQEKKRPGENLALPL
jgi:hypothetical protein